MNLNTLKKNERKEGKRHIFKDYEKSKQHENEDGMGVGQGDEVYFNGKQNFKVVSVYDVSSSQALELSIDLDTTNMYGV